MNKSFKRFIILVPMLLLGCAAPLTFEYTPPTSLSGQACIVSCEQERESCRVRAEAAYQKCEKEYVFDSRVFGDCEYVRGASGIHGGCSRPQLCAPPNTANCIKSYNSCYQNCGGQVSAIQDTAR